MAKTKQIEVGKEVLAECKKCKAETAHVVTVVKDGAVKKVLCSACQTEHAYKAPKSDGARGGAAANKTPTRRGRKKDWPSLVAKIEETEIADYDIHGDFTETPAIRHKKFGIGVVTKVLDDNKIEVLFQEDKKVLAQNWDE